MAYHHTARADEALEPSFNRYTVVSGNYRRPNLANDGFFAFGFKMLVGAVALTTAPLLVDLIVG